MFIISTLSFTTSLQSLCKLLYSYVDSFLRQAVPDHLQHFLEFDDHLPLRMMPVIASNVATAILYRGGLGPVVFGKVIWTFGSEQVCVTNFESMNKNCIMIQSLLLCGIGK